MPTKRLSLDEVIALADENKADLISAGFALGGTEEKFASLKDALRKEIERWTKGTSILTAFVSPKNGNLQVAARSLEEDSYMLVRIFLTSTDQWVTSVDHSYLTAEEMIEALIQKQP